MQLAARQRSSNPHCFRYNFSCVDQPASSTFGSIPIIASFQYRPTIATLYNKLIIFARNFGMSQVCASICVYHRVYFRINNFDSAAIMQLVCIPSASRNFREPIFSHPKNRERRERHICVVYIFCYILTHPNFPVTSAIIRMQCCIGTILLMGIIRPKPKIHTNSLSLRSTPHNEQKKRCRVHE